MDLLYIYLISLALLVGCIGSRYSKGDCITPTDLLWSWHGKIAQVVDISKDYDLVFWDLLFLNLDLDIPSFLAAPLSEPSEAKASSYGFPMV